MRANVISLAQTTSPQDYKDYVFDFLGDLAAYQVLGDRVLVATYIPPEKTKGGIIRPNANVGEVRFTGIVGLVLKLGPSAFKYDGQFLMEGAKPQAGDWVQYPYSDSKEFFFGAPSKSDGAGIPCRLIHCELIAAIVDDPERVARGNGFENL